MKKICLVIVILISLVLLCGKASAQFGLKGGVYTTNFSDLQEYKLRHNAGFQAGVVYKIDKLPFFTVQPELLFVQKKATIVDEAFGYSQKMNMDYIQLPVSVQFGLNLIVVRPYFQLVPYASYLVSGNFKGTDGYSWNDSNRFNYGLGIGGGVDFWKFQFNIRYHWDVKRVGGKSNTSDPIYERYKLSKGRALEISLALFF